MLNRFKRLRSKQALKRTQAQATGAVNSQNRFHEQASSTSWLSEICCKIYFLHFITRVPYYMGPRLMFFELSVFPENALHHGCFPMHVSLTQTRRSTKFESCVIESGQCALKRLFFLWYLQARDLVDWGLCECILRAPTLGTDASRLHLCAGISPSAQAFSETPCGALCGVGVVGGKKHRGPPRSSVRRRAWNHTAFCHKHPDIL